MNFHSSKRARVVIDGVDYVPSSSRFVPVVADRGAHQRLVFSDGEVVDLPPGFRYGYSNDRVRVYDPTDAVVYVRQWLNGLRVENA